MLTVQIAQLLMGGFQQAPSEASYGLDRVPKSTGSLDSFTETAY